MGFAKGHTVDDGVAANQEVLGVFQTGNRTGITAHGVIPGGVHGIPLAISHLDIYPHMGLTVGKAGNQGDRISHYAGIEHKGPGVALTHQTVGAGGTHHTTDDIAAVLADGSQVGRGVVFIMLDQILMYSQKGLIWSTVQNRVCIYEV